MFSVNARTTLKALGVLFFAFVAALLVVAGATKWLPVGAAGIDHVVVPIVAFPLVWITFALVLYVPRRRKFAWAAVSAVTLVHVGLVAGGFLL